MHILFVVPYTPCAIRPRSYNILRTLAARGHRLALATIWQTEQERDSLRELESMGITVMASGLSRARSAWNCLTALPAKAPLQTVYSWRPDLMRQIGQYLAGSQSRPDVAHVEHLRASGYGLRLRRQGLPVVFDSVDCISLLFEQAASQGHSFFGHFLSWLDLSRTRPYEPWLASQFDRVLITSPIDKAALVRLSAAARKPLTVDLNEHVTVLYHCVDLASFRPGTAPRQAANLVFSGRMSYHVNISGAVYFARQILPLIWASRPDVTFTIAGYDPVPEVRLLANDPRIIVTGTVPELMPFVQTATIAVAPMPFSTGIQTKILEAMACETPVVATPPPVEGLLAVPGRDLLVADGAPEFARQVVTLLEDAALRQRIGQAGRRYVVEHHDWGKVVTQLEGIYQDAIARRRSAP